MPPSSKRRLKDANAHRPNKTARHAKDLNRQRAADATSTAETAETLKTPELNSADASRLTGPQSELKALSPVSSNAQSAVIAWSKTVAAAGVIFHDVSCLSRPQPPAKVKATTPSSTFWNPERRALRASLETALTYAFRSDLALPMTTTQYCAREDALKLARLASLNPARQDIQAQAEAMIKYVAGFPADASRLSRNDLQTVVNQMCDDVNFRRVNPHLTNGDILRIRTLRWPYEVPCIAVLAPNGVDEDVKYPLIKYRGSNYNLLHIALYSIYDHPDTRLTGVEMNYFCKDDNANLNPWTAIDVVGMTPEAWRTKRAYEKYFRRHLEEGCSLIWHDQPMLLADDEDPNHYSPDDFRPFLAYPEGWADKPVGMSGPPAPDAGPVRRKSEPWDYPPFIARHARGSSI